MQSTMHRPMQKLNKVMIAIDTHTLLLKDNSYLPLNTSAETSQQLQ